MDGTLWGLENLGQDNGKTDADIDIEQAWNVTSGTPETVVAVIDTGVRVTHNDLIKPNLDERGRNSQQWS